MRRVIDCVGFAYCFPRLNAGLLSGLPLLPSRESELPALAPDRPLGDLDSETCPWQMDWESVQKTVRLECRGTEDGKQRQEIEGVVISQTKQ